MEEALGLIEKLKQEKMVLERALCGKGMVLERALCALRCAEQEKDELFKRACRSLCDKEEMLKRAKTEKEEMLRSKDEQLKRAKQETEKMLQCAIKSTKALENLRLELEECKKMYAEKAACCEKLEKQRHQGAPEAVVGLAWEFQANDGKWVQYTSASSDAITEAFLRGDNTCSFVHDGSSYEIILREKEMVQRNCATGKRRKIRYTAGVPAHWFMGNGTIIQQLKGEYSGRDTSLCGLGSLTLETILQPITEKRKLEEFSDLLRRSVFHHHKWQDPHSRCDRLRSRFVVCEAYHVENYLLYQGYRNHCRHLHSKHVQTGVMPQRICPDVPSALWELGERLGIGDDALNERVLFHGTSFDAAKQIALEGFDSRTAKPNGMYGQGTYFAAQSCKSHQYTKGGQGPLHTVLLARVALGDPHYAQWCDKTVRRPPKKENTEGSPLCDSLIAAPGWMEGHRDQWQSHMEFVIFEQMQAYPEYILRYRVASA